MHRKTMIVSLIVTLLVTLTAAIIVEKKLGLSHTLLKFDNCNFLKKKLDICVFSKSNTCVFLEIISDFVMKQFRNRFCQ